MYFDLTPDALFDAPLPDVGDLTVDAETYVDTYADDYTDPFAGYDGVDVPGLDLLDQPGAGDPAYPTVGFDPALGGPFDIEG